MRFSEKMKLLYRAYKYRYQVERAEIAFVLEQVEPGQTVIDIGAHKGAFTYWMQRRVGLQGKVFTFEPQPELAEYLARAKQGFGLDQVTIIHSALSDRVGTSHLYREGNSTPGATLNNHDSETHESVEVPLTTLDQYFADHRDRPIDFVKCDVEGHELEVFRGARRILTEDRPKLLFECEQRHMPTRSIREVFHFLQELDYQGWFFHRGKLLSIDAFRPEDNAAPRHHDYIYNFAFVHPSQGCVKLAA